MLYRGSTGKLINQLFVVYYCSSGPENSMKEECVSFCVISDCLECAANTFHSFISCIIHHLVFDILPHLRKVYYFSDGAVLQYKNCINFLKLCCDEEDFHIAAEWNFFATSRGKSPCDGIGGTVQRLVACASLQATEGNHILSTEDLY
jgi:hypothetical protein